MRRHLSRLLAGAALAGACATASARQEEGPVPRPTVVLHVSPGGNDAWSGTLNMPNADRTDGPLATPVAALRAARKLRSAGPVGAVTILLRAGTYRLAQPLVITPEDSGEPASPLTIAAQEGATAVLSGGAALGPWRTVEVNGKRLWAANVPVTPPTQDPAVSSPWVFRELFVNGKRRTRARHPDTGFLRIQDVPNVKAGSQWTDGKNYLRFREADAGAWTGTEGAEAVVMSRWVDNHLAISSVDASTRTARFTKRAVLLFNTSDLYYLEGAPTLLDAPGEWCLDRGAGIVYYMRDPADDPASPLTFDGQDALNAVAPVLTSLVRVQGDPETGRLVHDVHFRGLTFSHAQWWFTDSAGKTAPEWAPRWPSPEACGFQQAAWGLPGAIVVRGANRVGFDRCTVSHVGGYAIELGRGCRSCQITGCTLTDLGGGGVKIGEAEIREADIERTDHNEVRDTRIVGGGRIHHQAVGVWIGQSGDNIISHNLIQEMDYSGISMGWTWGYGASLAGGNIVEFNDIGFLGKHDGNTEPPLGDMGGIYTLGTQTGTIIRNNFFHDIAGHTIAWGMYFDEGTTGVLAENNVVTRTSHGGFHQHYGKDNIVRNNIFVLGRDAQLHKTRREEHTAFTFERNIVYWRSGPLLAGDWAGNDYRSGHNLFCNAGDAILFPGEPARTLKQWQDAGREEGSIIGEPRFVDLDHDRFGLQEGSPALGLGFNPIDLKDVGPRKRTR